jgi:hypothetical protein
MTLLSKLSKRSILKCDRCDVEFERDNKSIEKLRSKYNEFDYCAICCRSESLARRNRSQKGMTLEEKWGKQKADEYREKRSKLFKGENNPNYGGKYSRWGINKENKGKTYEERYGEEKAKELRKKLSHINSGENNNMYGKPSPQGSGNGWKGWYKGTYFASLRELFYIKYLYDNNVKFENGEQRKYRIQYEFNSKKLNYFLDFYLPETDEYIEIKPKKLNNSPKNKAKFEAAREKLGDKFKVLNEEDLQPIDLETMYNLYLEKEIIFMKKYEEKFIQYYNKNKKG